MNNNKADLRDEYWYACDSMKEYAKMRFAQLTLFIAITAGLLTVLFASDFPFTYYPRMALKIGALIITYVFFIMEERSNRHWAHYKKRADELEKLLKYRLHSTRPLPARISATNAVRLLYVFMLGLWSVTIIWHPMF